MSSATDEQDFETLPVVSFKEEILAAVKRSQIVIIIGETGSGKTTQIPQFFADENLLGGKQLAVTQPRRIAAISVAQRVSDERRGTIGGEVGYTVRFDDKTTSRTKIKFMTDGILVRECLSDRSLSNYSIIMLDEAHERSLNTDILFGLLKGACKLRPDLKLIITSATLNTDKFGPYFMGCPIIHVPGRVFPVDIYHSKTKQVMTASGPSNSSYVQAAVDVILKIHKKDEDGHILVFLTGQDEIERACSLLRAALKDESAPDRELLVLPIYAALTSEQQSKVFKHPRFLLPKGASETMPNGAPRLLRKCVIATNIAETSITVPQVRFVVDSGYVKQKAYDPSRGMESLVVVPSSKIASIQRAGRAGRTGPGQCYRLYSSECFDNMMEETVPEIQRINLANTVLYLKALGIHDILGFDFLDPPSVDQIMEALSQLYTLRAIDHNGHITPLGRQMSSFPLEPNLARMLIKASECDCLEEVTTICAMLSAESIWITPPPPSREARFAQKAAPQQNPAESRLQMNFNKYGNNPTFSGQRFGQNSSSGGGNVGFNNNSAEEHERARQAHAALSHPYGDFHTYLNVYNMWEKNNRSVQWCERNFVNFRSMKTVASIREHLSRDAKKVLDRASHSNRYTDHNSERDHRDSRDSRDGDRNRDREDRESKHHKDGKDGKEEKGKEKEGEHERSLEKRISTAVTAGYFMNSAVLCAHGNVFKYMSLLDLERQRNKQDALDVRMVHIHPTSSLSEEGTECPHTYVLYQALVHSSKLFMKQIARADSKLLKTLQREWQYVDPYVLCGRQHERPTAMPAVPEKASKEAQSSNKTATASAVSASAAASSRPTDHVPTERNIAGAKRPLSPSTAPGAPVPASAAPPAAPSGTSAAAEAAKQRYMERMAQQKARKN